MIAPPGGSVLILMLASKAGVGINPRESTTGAAHILATTVKASLKFPTEIE
jgi:hypothetical protein